MPPKKANRNRNDQGAWTGDDQEDAGPVKAIPGSFRPGNKSGGSTANKNGPAITTTGV